MRSIKSEAPAEARPLQRLPERNQPIIWALSGLKPTPEEEWDRLRTFLSLSEADTQAMLETVEPLFKRGPELIVGNYDYLLKNPETAAILGWDSGPDPEHLAERRRFFTVWLARTLGMDLSHDFAHYLFRAGQLHAGHGPRQVNVPELYVTGAASLVNATFARFLEEEMPSAAVVPAALAGWNKVLTMHLHMMLIGYHSAVELDQGDFAVPVKLFGRMRTLLRCKEFTLHMPSGGQVVVALRKIFNYYPQIRNEVFETGWLQGDRLDAFGNPWMTVEKAYQVRKGWRLLLNGRDLTYGAGPEQILAQGDIVQLFPPGR